MSGVEAGSGKFITKGGMAWLEGSRQELLRRAIKTDCRQESSTGAGSKITRQIGRSHGRSYVVPMRHMAEVLMKVASAEMLTAPGEFMQKQVFVKYVGQIFGINDGWQTFTGALLPFNGRFRRECWTELERPSYSRPWGEPGSATEQS